MAIDPSQISKPEKRFFPNTETTLLQIQDPKLHLVQSASRILRDCPPVLPWPSPFRDQVYKGLFIGPTSVAYLFWRLYETHPELKLEGKLPDHWCEAYLELGQDDVPPSLHTGCGVANEYLSFNTLKACFYQDETYANKVLEALQSLDVDPTWCEWLKGRAGALYLLRIMRKSHPRLARSISQVITTLIEDILPQQPWVWSNRQYLGTVHGEIGIITQIVLCDQSYAERLESKLLSLLTLQGADGNWPVIEGKDLGLVHFCHGAPGFVLSLLAIKQYFPTLQNKINEAIASGRKIIWERGLLTKEPNICHGITGNALALERPQRDHFLCQATPDIAQQGVRDGKFEISSDPFGILWGEAGRSWVWLQVWDGIQGRVAIYTDL